MNEHVGRLRLFHIDAYRLGDPERRLDAGLFDERQAAWRQRTRRRVGRSARRMAARGPARDHPDPRQDGGGDRRSAGAAMGHGPVAHERLADAALEPRMIIAIETASTDLSLAIAVPTAVIVADRSVDKRRAARPRELLPRLLALLAAADRELSDATAVGGRQSVPGSFTGLRVVDERSPRGSPSPLTSRSLASRAWGPGSTAEPECRRGRRPRRGPRCVPLTSRRDRPRSWSPTDLRRLWRVGALLRPSSPLASSCRRCRPRRGCGGGRSACRRAARRGPGRRRPRAARAVATSRPRVASGPGRRRVRWP